MSVPPLSLVDSTNRISLLSTLKKYQHNRNTMTSVSTADYIVCKHSKHKCKNIQKMETKQPSSHRNYIDVQRNNLRKSHQIHEVDEIDETLYEDKSIQKMKKVIQHDEQILVELKNLKINPTITKNNKKQSNNIIMQSLDEDQEINIRDLVIEPKVYKQIRKVSCEKQTKCEVKKRTSPEILQYGFQNKQYDPYYPHESLKQIVNGSNNIIGSHISKTQYKEPKSIDNYLTNNQKDRFSRQKCSDKQENIQKYTSIQLIDKNQQMINTQGSQHTQKYWKSKSSIRRKNGITVYSATQKKIGNMVNNQNERKMAQIQSIILQPEQQEAHEKLDEISIEQKLRSIDKLLLDNQFEEQMKSLCEIKDQTNKQCSQNLKSMNYIINKYQVKGTQKTQKTLDTQKQSNNNILFDTFLSKFKIK